MVVSKIAMQIILNPLVFRTTRPVLEGNTGSKCHHSAITRHKCNINQSVPRQFGSTQDFQKSQYIRRNKVVGFDDTTSPSAPTKL